MNLSPKTVFAIGAVVLIGAYLAKKQVAAAATAVGQAINPVSDQNIFYKGAGAVTGALTGSDLPLGSQIYDWFNGP